jgi:hexosaminidase
MLCGPSNIWPEPTIKSLLGTNSNDVRLTDIQIKVKTPFKRVESLMENAFLIFLNELKQIEQSNEQSRNDDSNNSVNSKTVSVGANNNNVDSNDKNSNFYDSSERLRHHRGNFSSVNIYVDISKDPDIYLTLQTDECYNLTVIREYLFYS